jgi:hypothetical protein
MRPCGLEERFLPSSKLFPSLFRLGRRWTRLAVEHGLGKRLHISLLRELSNAITVCTWSNMEIPVVRREIRLRLDVYIYTDCKLTLVCPLCFICKYKNCAYANQDTDFCGGPPCRKICCFNHSVVRRMLASLLGLFVSKAFVAQRLGLKPTLYALISLPLIRRYSGVWLLTRCGMLAKAGYDVRDYGLCIFMLIFFGLLARWGAFMLLIGLHRDKQK